MLTSEQINAIHRLHWAEHWSTRRIANHLHIGRDTIAKYLHNPAPAVSRRQRGSILDPFKPAIQEMLEKDPRVSAQLVRDKLHPLGYQGGFTLVKDYLQALRTHASPQRAYVRMEPPPGDRFEMDWGHFGSLDYNGAWRKLYAFCLIECHSRKLYVEFTHSQSFETFVRCHIHAFTQMGGVARELWYDNLATAVAEHDGNLVRFQPRFLSFARQFSFVPRACHVAAAWEKGKVERAVGYLRQSFWPLRQFQDLADVNRQVRLWLDEVANQRRHRETGQTPDQRFRPDCLRALPALSPDYRDTTEALVHKDIRLAFDGNRYCVPPRYAGQRLTVKADAHTLTIYDQHQQIVQYARCYQRGQTFGAERFEKELFAQLAAARASDAQRRLHALLGPGCEGWLRKLAETERALSRQVKELLVLIRDFGQQAVVRAIQKAESAAAYGSDYIANILHQQRRHRIVQPPLQLRNAELNELATDPLSLLDYDSFILQSPPEQDKE
ncbi:MAG: IS21 family transposase [Bryobacterales bacterium]|nr:IS21 family transposase [Bryobacterales bacterium]